MTKPLAVPLERWAVVLAGGIGSRFWPMSTPEQPKQLLPLIDDQPMLVNTLDRLGPLVPAERTLILTNAGLAEPILAALPGFPAANLVAEPRPAGTAAALAWAAAEIERRAGGDAVMLCVHADWSIDNVERFRDTLREAADLAESTHGLVTVGIVPSRPDPGFGYIEPGAPISAEGMTGTARAVTRFVEKPTRERAAEMCAAGYLWNSGIFVWRVRDFLDEVRTRTPEVAPALAAYADASPDLERFFAAVKSVSVDVGVLERTQRIYVIPGDFGWDDVGTWAALRRVRRPDAEGNVMHGTAHTIQATGNVIHAGDGAVVLFGVSDLVVVTRPGLTFVTTVDKASDLKTLIDALPESVRVQ